MEDYYFLKKNLPALPLPEEIPPLRISHKALVAQSMKKMKESMRQFAKDNDVIHVTIDRQSLQQLTKLSEIDIKKDENIQLVNNKRESQTQFESTYSAEASRESMMGSKGFRHSVVD